MLIGSTTTFTGPNSNSSQSGSYSSTRPIEYSNPEHPPPFTPRRTNANCGLSWRTLASLSWAAIESWIIFPLHCDLLCISKGLLRFLITALRRLSGLRIHRVEWHAANKLSLGEAYE